MGARLLPSAQRPQGLIAMSSIVTAPAAGRRRARGLRKLSSENISKAMDETGAQVPRIGLTFFGTTAFCFLSLFSPDSAKRSTCHSAGQCRSPASCCWARRS
jgi:hypothetical protein